MILYLKNGSGIHIKKKNRGKFTSYCGGNVTSACIAKAKASGNPTLVKRATFAANARKWKHQFGGILGREEAYKINEDNRNTAKGLFKGIFSGDILPTMDNLGRMVGAAWDGWIEPKSPYLTGAPDVLPGKVGKTKDAITEVKQVMHSSPVKNTLTESLIKAVERRQDKDISMTKKLKTTVKHSQSFDDMDMRHIKSGRDKTTGPQRERAHQLMTGPYSDKAYGDWYPRLKDLSKKRSKIDPLDKKAMKKINQQINDLYDEFIHNSGFF